MSKKFLAACLMATALTTAPAIAQTSPSSSQFMKEQSQSEWRGSKLMGLDVYGTDNQKIGDIRDVLLDRSGEAKTVVIGVGGFLGIGEKDVAVPFKSLQFKDEPIRSSGASSSTGSGTASSASRSTASADRNTTATTGTGSVAANTGAAAGAGSNMTAGTGNSAAGSNTVTSPSPMGTNTTASTSTSSTPMSGRDTAAHRGYPDHAVLSMTKNDLQNAPEFHYAGSTSRDTATSRPAGSTGTGPATGAGTGTAPRQ